MGFMIDVFARAGDWLSEWFRSMSTAELDQFTETEDVTWVGGPLDGLRRPVDTAEIWHLPPVLEIPIYRSRMECPMTRAFQANERPTSIAAYQLDFDSDRWFYRFVHSTAPPQVQ